MALPKQIQDQVDLANKIVDDMQAPPPDDDDPKLKAVEDAPAEEPSEEAAAPEGPPVEEPTPEVEAAEETPEASDEESYKQRYKVLQGKYNAEVPVLNRRVAELSDQVTGLQQIIAKTQEAPQPVPAITKETMAPLFTKEELEDYGDDFMDIVGRKANQIADQAMEPLRQQIIKLQQQQDQTDTQLANTAQERVIQQLANEVSNWEEINEDPLFLDWLNKPDLMSGMERGRMLNDAFRAGRGESVIAIFRSYLQEHAAVSTESSGPSKEDDSPKVDMDTLVSPGKGRTTRKVADAQHGKQTWTEQEVAAFYADCQKGKFKDNPKERKRIEDDIFAAIQDGRFVPNMQTPVSNAPY